MSDTTLSQPDMPSHADLIRYDIRRDRAGWTVYDVRSGAIAVIDEVLQVGLDMDEADAVADALSTELPPAPLAGIMPRFAWFQTPARP